MPERNGVETRRSGRVTLRVPLKIYERGSNDRFLDEEAHAVNVIWPPGKVETLTNLAANRFYKVKEGKGIVSSEPPRSSEINHR
jgi:hypothetical protein